MTLTLLQSVILAGALGVSAHLGYFIRGEHHRQGIYILAIVTFYPWIASAALVRYYDFSIANAIVYSLATEWTWILSLWTSMVVYRSFFHSLHNFPGPFGAKTTKLWHSVKGAKMRWYIDAYDLHAQYGDYVRTGPNEISIADPQSIDLIHGSKSRCIKAPWYDLGYPDMSLQLTRERAVHDKRRRVGWQRAFTTNAVRGYDPTVTGLADELIGKLGASNGKPMNVSKWYNFFTADVMSSLGYGEPFNMLKDGENHWSITILQEGSSFLSTLGPIPWLLTLLVWFPFLARANYKAKLWSNGQIDKSLKRKIEKGNNLLEYLFEPLEPMCNNNPKQEKEWLYGDARLAIIAGTDTTTAALTYTSYHMAKDPEIACTIRKELIANGVDKEFSTQRLQDCKYLQSVIDESMRLHPPVPDGVYRMTPPEGLQIGETFIPGNVTVINPIYIIQRSSKSFVKPEEFIPDRWTTKPELILDERAYLPFIVGPYSCVGKNLALNELRTVLAKVVLNFDISFAPGEDGTKLLEETKDYFVLGLADLNLIYTPIKA